jgi:FkbM family methyltransferase
MNAIKKAWWFVRQSLFLDIRFLIVSRWSLVKKIEFLLKKYWLIIKHYYRRFVLGKHSVNLFGSEIYYDSQFGLAGYQRTLTTHQYLLRLAHVDSAQTIIDIGANVGFFSKLCRELFPDARVYAIEPIPQIYTCLKRNFEADQKTSLFDIAITDMNGEAMMDFDSDLSSISHLSEGGNVKVKTVTLDDFVAQNNITVIDVLKIDVETFEAQVLRGGKKALEMTDILFIEITMENNKNYTISSLLKMLSTEAYDYQLVGFRNYADTGEGEMPTMDAVFKNIKKA